MVSFISRPRLQDSINATRARIKRARYEMKVIREHLVLADIMQSADKLSEYEKLNEEMRRAKIYEAELVYLRNQL